MYKNAEDGAAAMKFLATKPVVIITTLHPTGVVNAGVFGAYTGLSSVHIGAAIHTESHTYANVLREKEFVVNVPGSNLVKTLAVIADDDVPPEKSEVAEAGLSLKPPLKLQVPSIAECAAAVEFVFEKEVPVGGHSLLIARAVAGWIRSDFLDDDGRINIFKAQVMKDFKYPLPLYVLPGEVVCG
ncbi:MAG TPA: flavin reductase family protein [Planctomycetes bacterium]|nr:flavin reductase family protein [Planctomycetota bacterium]